MEGEAGGESKKTSERMLDGGDAEGGLDGGVEDGVEWVIGVSCLPLGTLMGGWIDLWV